MAVGPGKYDPEAQGVREATHAQSVMLIVINGDRGSGFSVQSDLTTLARLPTMLRFMAEEIDKDLGQT